jgi:hypothetical protein
MIIQRICYPDYDIDDYSQYEPPPKPYADYYSDGEWKHDPVEATSASPELFEAVIAAHVQDVNDYEFNLIVKSVEKRGTATEAFYAEEALMEEAYAADHANQMLQERMRD